AVAAGLDVGEPALRRLLLPGRELGAAERQPAMRAGADADIVAVAPIEQIVPAFGPGPRMVGDLIGRHQAGLELRLRRLVEIGREPVLRHREIAACMLRMKRGSRLDGELVERQMVGREVEGAAELGFPFGDALPGTGIDEIEGEAREMARREIDRGARLAGRMLAAEKVQGLLVEALHPERYAVDAGGAESQEFLRLDRGRIGFERHFRIGAELPVPGDAVEHRADAARAHQRRRAAAEKDAADAAPRADLAGLAIERLQQRPRPGTLVDRLADMAVEIAIGALRAAEGPMHIDAERPRIGPGRALADRDHRALRHRRLRTGWPPAWRRRARGG